MSFLLKKVIKPWNPAKDTDQLNVPEKPMCPPSPDLSHLTPDEINVINDVIRRQEEFDRQEAERVRRLREELDGLQEQLSHKFDDSTHSKKLVDLRLCRLCFKTKFPDGVGRVCHDCQQRVCLQCGAFSKPRWNARKNKNVRGRWRCKLCMARREVLCRTGGWYHGTSFVSEEIKRKLSVPPEVEGETDAGSSTCQGNYTNIDDSENCPSGNRTDSELVHRVPVYSCSRRTPISKKSSRRRSLPPDTNGKEKSSDDLLGDVDDDEEEDERDSLNTMILERRLSRRKRQEKRQRRKMRADQEGRSSESLYGRSLTLPGDGNTTTTDSERARTIVGKNSGQRRDSVTRSLWGHSNSLNSCIRKPSPISEIKNDSTSSSESSVFSPFRDSSVSDLEDDYKPHSPVSLKIIRQDALSLHSSCISFTSTSESKLCDGRRGYTESPDLVSARSRDSFSPHSSSGQDAKIVINRDSLSPETSGEKSVQRWRQCGFHDAFLISLNFQGKDPPYGVKLTGGVQKNTGICQALVSWISADIKSRISVGQEILEWNGETLRGKTYDHVNSVMSSSTSSQVVLIVSPAREDVLSLPDDAKVITADRPPSHSPESYGKGGKRRMLPRTPVEIKRGTRNVKGELQIKLYYHPGKSSLAVTVLRARHLSSPNHVEGTKPNPFVVICLVPGKSGRNNLETELRTSDDQPEWEQTFLLDGITLTEVVTRAVQLSLWSYEDRSDYFMGEVLLDLAQIQLDNQTLWYHLEEHDENSAPLPHRRGSQSASMTASVTSSSFKDSTFISPAVSPEVPSHRLRWHSPSSTGSTNVSPVPFGTSQVGSREFHLNSVSQPDSFTTKVRKKMRNTVSKMSSLSLIEKRENAATVSDESSHSDIHRRSSDKSDKGFPHSKSPSNMKRRQNSNHSMDLLAPPQPPSRTNSSSSFFLSDDEESQGRYSISPTTPDRPRPEGDDITSLLGPGQIPPKPSAETTVCGDIKLGFMVSKGQLEVDILCAAALHKSGHSQPPDTYVKTYLVEGKKVIQRKKTLVVKSTFDPVYRKKIKYSACNVHGRIMKINIWERTGSFEKKSCRGEVLVRMDGLDLSKHTMAWYKLFEMNSTDYGSDEFLNSW